MKKIKELFRNNPMLISGILIVIILTTYYIYSKNTYYKVKKINSKKDIFENTTIKVEKKDLDEAPNSTKEGEEYLIEGDFLSDNIVTDEELKAMEHNTKVLQLLVDSAEENEVITLKEGVYYFTKGGSNTKGNEDYVIKLSNNVNITGAGTSKEISTILKPYAKENTIEYGLDMFYYNELIDSQGTNPQYLENVSFSNFIIDGKSVRGKNYNTSGKGFMINLCRNCFWNNITIQNTDATGFGMDNIINGKISNSTAINCGKNASANSEGASGFGIGTGYSNEESVIIENCKSIGNKKYGYFFEHQGIFNRYYQANSSKGFIVRNSTATGNLYNFGGRRANDTSYINCTSTTDTTDQDGTPINYTKQDIYFDDQSRRTLIQNFQIDKIPFSDINQNSYYYKAIEWAYKNSITYGTDKNNFGIGKEISRAEAITLLWRYSNRPGDVLVDNLVSTNSLKQSNIDTGFIDVSKDAWYAQAIKWGKEQGITNGTTVENFSPNSSITRAQFVTMLYRYAGSPKVNSTNNFADVKSNSSYYDAINWAANKGITNGTTTTTFSPDKNCTREEVITMLYRYNNIK